MENICKYCNKKFVSLSTLNKHIKTTPAYCLKIQKKILTSGGGTVGLKFRRIRINSKDK